METLLATQLTVSADSIFESARNQGCELEVRIQDRMWYRHEEIRRDNSHLERASIPAAAIKACFPHNMSNENPEGNLRKCDDGFRHVGLTRYILELSSNSSMTRRPVERREQYMFDSKNIYGLKAKFDSVDWQASFEGVACIWDLSYPLLKQQQVIALESPIFV